MTSNGNLPIFLLELNINNIKLQQLECSFRGSFIPPFINLLYDYVALEVTANYLDLAYLCCIGFVCC